MEIDVWGYVLWQDMIRPFWCRRHLPAAASRADAHSSGSCVHLRSSANSQLEFYGSYATSQATILHYGHVRAPSSWTTTGLLWPADGSGRGFIWTIEPAALIKKLFWPRFRRIPSSPGPSVHQQIKPGWFSKMRMTSPTSSNEMVTIYLDSN